MESKDKVLICKVVAQAILADAQITDSEWSLIDKLMNRYELDEGQRKEVLARNIDDDPAQFAEQITSFDSKNELLVELALVVAVDGEISSPERIILEKIASVFSVEKDELDLMLKAAIA
ncbi:MAG: TerB family tellurite resistance protein [Proteobacteria bacterium]|nr:TerB family tellurite resistance protein [Pseudomonadota bacterium]